MRIEIFNGTFWGIVLIILGILLIVKYIFNVQFPVFRILIAVLFIYLGIRILLGNCCGYRSNSCDNSAAFTEKEFSYNANQNNYNCVFGSSSLDLSELQITANKTIDVSVVFGEFRVKLNKDQNIEIISNTAFGSTDLPYENVGGFGSKTFRTPKFNESLPHLTIRTNVAFGSMKISYI